MFQNLFQIIKFFLVNHTSSFLKLCFLLLLENLSTILNILAVVPLAEFLVDNDQKSVISVNFEKTLNLFSIDLTFVSILITFLALYFIKGLLGYFVIVFLANLRLDFQKNISSKTLNSLLFTSWKFITSHSHGKFINSLNNESEKFSNIFYQSGLFIAMLLRIIALLITPFILSPNLLSLTFSILMILSLPILLLSKLNRSLGQVNTKTNNNIQLFFYEIFNSLKVIIGLNMGKFFINKYKTLFSKYKNVEIKSQILSQGIVFYLNFISVLALVILLYINFKYSLNEITILAAIFWSLYNAVPAFSSIINSIYKINNISPSYDQINELISEANFKTPKDKGKIITNITSDITFKNVSFSYAKNKILFDKMNIIFKSKKLNIIFGASGKGKSTIIDLILRLLDPDTGEIRINNKNIKDYKISSLRNLFSFLPQEPTLFEGTVRENLTLFLNKKIGDKEIKNTLFECNLLTFVNEKEEGLEFNIGSKGNRISGGQKQRLALARSLISKPKLLFVDEPTSSLDYKNTEEMINLLLSLSKKITIIMITHNKKLLKYSKNVIYL